MALHSPDLLELLLKDHVDSSGTTIPGADPNIYFANGHTALPNVVRWRQRNKHAFNTLTLLLQYNADPNLAHIHTKVTPLMLAAYSPQEIEYVKLLLEYGADVTAVNTAGHTVLNILCNNNGHRTEPTLAMINLCKEYIDINAPGSKPLLK